jgi:hypothetical protein
MTRNQAVHGGITSDQKALNRTKLLRTITTLYKKDRSHLPLQERSLFNLPLPLHKKQGNQQLHLWIQRATLLFETYKEIPISGDQQQKITEWLEDWEPDSDKAQSQTVQTKRHVKITQDWLHLSENDIDDDDV